MEHSRRDNAFGKTNKYARLATGEHVKHQKEVREDEMEQSVRRLEGESRGDGWRKIDFLPLDPGTQPVIGILAS
jgi:hypothetical protein